MRGGSKICRLCLLLWLLAGGVFGNAALGLAVIVHLCLLAAGCRKRRCLCISDRTERYLGAAMLLCGMGTFLWGVDRGLAWMGVLRLLSAMLFRLWMLQFSDEERREMLEMLPWAGALMTMISAVGSAFPAASAYFTQAGRLSGFFQYANTCALFLLLGIVVLHHKKEREKKDALCYAALAAGLYLSGARTVWLCYLGYEIWKLLRKESAKRFYLPAAAVLALAVAASVGGLSASAGRFLTIRLSASTFLGRLLYARDALPMLVKYPLGMGYLGYFYVQRAMQTGVYSVRFAHNDLLQAGLDYGLPFFILAAIFLARALRRERNNWLNRELIAVILAGSLLDLHLQFQLILWILLLACGEGEKERIDCEKQNIFVRLAAGILAAAYVLNGAGEICLSCGKYDAAAALAPWNTEALVYRMLSRGTLTEASADAERILRRNPYQREAHQIMAYYDMQRKDFAGMAKECEEVISLNKYKEEGYAEYQRLLEDAVSQCVEAGRIKEAKALQEKLPYIEDMKREAVLNTSFLAYYIDEKPEI